MSITDFLAEGLGPDFLYTHDRQGKLMAFQVLKRQAQSVVVRQVSTGGKTKTSSKVVPKKGAFVSAKPVTVRLKGGAPVHPSFGKLQKWPGGGRKPMAPMKESLDEDALVDLLSERSIASGAKTKAKTRRTGKGRTMSTSDIGDEPVTAFNVSAADGTKVAIVIRGERTATGNKRPSAEVWWPGQKRIRMGVDAALRFKGMVPMLDKSELKQATKDVYRRRREDVEGADELLVERKMRPYADYKAKGWSKEKWLKAVLSNLKAMPPKDVRGTVKKVMAQAKEAGFTAAEVNKIMRELMESPVDSMVAAIRKRLGQEAPPEGNPFAAQRSRAAALVEEEILTAAKA